MQIERIILFHRDGLRRKAIRLRTGELNVITGISETGKSLLIEIVDYCLGADPCGVYDDDLTRMIGWYGLDLRIGSQTIGVARKAPEQGRKSNARAHLSIGAALPAADRLVQNSSIDAVVLRLAALVGIDDTLQQSPIARAEGAPARATLRNALAFAFQRQYEIAHPKLLFTGQDKPFVAYGIRDTLPYFLGAVDHDALDTRRQLARLRREHARAASAYSEAARRANDVRHRAAALLGEAKDAGLVTVSDVPGHPPEVALSVLQEAVLSPSPRLPSTTVADELRLIGDRQEQVATQLRAVRSERRALAEQENDLQLYSEEVDEQRSRLSLVGVVPSRKQDDGSTCPFCGALHGEPDATLHEMTASLDALGSRLTGAEQDRPRLREANDSLAQVEAELRAEQRRLDEELTALSRRQEAAARLRTFAETQAFVRGRLAAFLENVPPVDHADLERLRLDAEDLNAQIERLQNELSADTTRMRTETVLNAVGRRMKKLASSLDLQYADEPALRLDPVRLDVVAETGAGETRWLSEDVGAGKNWVGYHVVTLVALHTFFVENRRPVPHILMLDQVSQAFFPPERRDDAHRKVTDLEATERTKVLRIFRLLDETCQSANGDLQIIVSDHADFSETWFRRRVACDWWSGDALIPPSWAVPSPAPQIDDPKA